MAMDLRTLTRGILDLPKNIPAGLPVSGIYADSRKVRPGGVFIAVPGLVHDGHDFLADAACRGAALLVTMRDCPAHRDKTIVVPSTRELAGLLAARYYGDPASHMTTVGVTGTNGKTTVTWLLEAVFARAGRIPGVIGTLTYRWPGYEEKAVRTTPDSLELQELLIRMATAGCDTAVMEVSSHALTLRRTSGMSFDAAVYTNISRDHLDFHRTEAAYRDAKALLFTQIKAGGVAVVNGDDPAADCMLSAASERAVTYGWNDSSDYRIDAAEMSAAGTRYRLLHAGEGIPVETPLTGGFNIANTAAAAVTGFELGLEPGAVLRGIADVRGIPGRMQTVCPEAPFSVLVDYAHTPQALANVLSAVRGFTRGRLLVVFGCGGDRDRGKRPEMGRIAVDMADLVFVTSDNPRSEDPKSIIDEILSGMGTASGATVIQDRRMAIREAITAAEKGDSLVIAGKGHEEVQIIGNTSHPFSDAQVARECIAETRGIRCG
ncbi:UDP-N-acetylmuramoyl-L-alanyl-D-glutamate--2,6-diaminopimelate ligase [bacterium]|nr:UDP-N-acetylmuramoyl-L-alanyl-D-glutamate--2,6-diaminopimelate ligase [bacterium]